MLYKSRLRVPVLPIQNTPTKSDRHALPLHTDALDTPPTHVKNNENQECSKETDVPAWMKSFSILSVYKMRTKIRIHFISQFIITY